MPPRAKLSSIRARASVAAGPINGWFELSSARHGRRNMNRHIKSFAPRVSRRQFMIGAAGLSFAIALDGTNVATVLARQRTGEALSPRISIGTDGTITIMAPAVGVGEGPRASPPVTILAEVAAECSPLKIK